mgnify:CR=1 FL=1
MLKKLMFKAGINRENTRYTTEGGYYDCDKIRFRQGTPQKIGGWSQISPYTYLGVCRSLWNWETLSSINYTGVGTNLKFYVMYGGGYYDITPIRSQQALSNPFTATTGSAVLAVHAVGHGAIDGDFVTFNGAVGLGGNISAAVLNDIDFQITYVDADNYTITVSTPASASDTGHGGTAVNAVYEINTGSANTTVQTGWGGGTWGSGTWGYGGTSTASIRLWSQSNFGEDLVFGPRGGAMYYYNASEGVTPISATITIASPAVITANTTLNNYDPVMFTTTGSLPTGITAGVLYYVRKLTTTTFNISATPTGALINTSGTQSGDQAIAIRGVPLTAMYGASDVPVIQNYITVADTYRFVFAFGCNDYGSTNQNPLLLRWCDQEDITNWTPAATNQAGSLLLSRGSKIVSAIQTRQEIIVFTDTSIYALQYIGPPYVWGSQLMGTNISVVSQNCMAQAADVVYWMGVDKFYKYDGRSQTLRCDIKEYIFNDINLDQADQIFASTVERFNEIWWFYVSSDSLTVNKYAVYNYLEDIWYYGTMARTAWIDTGTIGYPLAATYSNNLVYQEFGLDDSETSTTAAIDAYITTSEFDIDDGHNFAFIRRILPDLTFRGSTTESPTVTMSVIPLNNSGSGYTDPASVGGEDNAAIVRTAVVPIEAFTGQVFIRVRGRQFSFKIESNQIGTTWQLGSPRIDYQLDGRRST